MLLPNNFTQLLHLITGKYLVKKCIVTGAVTQYFTEILDSVLQYQYCSTAVKQAVLGCLLLYIFNSFLSVSPVECRTITVGKMGEYAKVLNGHAG